MIDNLSSLETILTSVLTSLGLASPLVVSAVKFVFSEYKKLRDAVDMVMMMDSRLEEIEARIKSLGGGSPDSKIKAHLDVFRKNLKESFNRRDERIGLVEHRVEEVKLGLEKAPDLRNNLHKRIEAITTRINSLEEGISQIKKDSEATKEPVIQAIVPKDTTGDHIAIASLETEIGKLRRALLRLGQKTGVDITWELHEKKSTRHTQEAFSKAESAEIDWESIGNELKEELSKPSDKKSNKTRK